jgi:NDP-sugar pyrophosphorylase family protein
MKPTLLVLAAGIGSRYGGLKQVDGLGPGGHAILEYSVFDAIRAGFGKVVFVIRKEIDEVFREKIGDRMVGHIQVEYAYQELDTALEWWTGPKIDRVKPWGTGHAVLAAKHLIQEPFAVINADDFYGQEAYQVLADFLTTDCASDMYAMVGYKLKNTLSENGSVSRGVCNVNADGNLTEVIERTKIYRDDLGKIVFEEPDGVLDVPEDAPVSMNFWGFSPDMMQVTEDMFRDFVAANHENLKSEFYIPLIANAQIQNGNARLRVLQTDSEWFGVTYTADKEIVQAALFDQVASGVYPEQLWVS